MAEKRPFSYYDSEQQPRKRRRVIRTLQHIQRTPQHVEPAPQDAAFVRSQLLQSISASLSAVGFDSVSITALEMFRSHAEEYMLRFGTYIRTSMHLSLIHI